MRDLVLSLAAKIVILVSNLGVQVCLAWLLGPAGRGAYAVCTLYTAVLSTIFLIGCEPSSLYFVSSKRLSISAGGCQAGIYVGLGSLMAILAGLLTMQLPLAFFEKANRQELLLSLACVPICAYGTILLQLFTAVKRFLWFTVLMTLRGVALFACTMLFLGPCSLGVPGAMLGILTADLAVIFASLMVLHSEFGMTWARPDIPQLLAMLHYGVRYWIGAISNQANFRVGMLILGFFAAREEIGIYSLALGVAVQMLVLPDAVLMALVPRAASDDAGRKYLVAQCARLMALVSLTLLAVILLLASPLTALLFPQAFGPAALLIQILAFAFVLRSIGKSLEPYLIGSNHPGVISWSVFVGMVINLIGILLLLPQFGMYGAAWSVVLNYLTSSAILVVGFTRLAKMDLLATWRPRWSDLAFVKESLARTMPRTARKGGVIY